MIRPYSIALLYGGEPSRRYAEIMKQVIFKESVYYPYIPIMISPAYWQEKGKNGARISHIMKELSKCDYVYLFLSAFYKGNDMCGNDKESERYIPKLNPIFEYGYLLNSLGDEKITIIPDFSYEDYKKGIFVFLSDQDDLLTVFNREIKSAIKNDDKKLSKKFSCWFKDDMKVQKVFPKGERLKYNKLIFGCNRYIIDYGELFEKEIILLRKYKLSEQIESLLQSWASEMSEFDELDKEKCFSYKIMFCYERLLLYLSIQKANTSWLKSLYFDEANNNYSEPQRTAIEIYNSICEYIQFMGVSKKEKNKNFFLDKATSLSKKLKELPQTTNPLITTITHNYIGLSYLNYFNLHSEDEKTHLKIYLNWAEDEFKQVIQACEQGREEKLQEVRNTKVILSYVYFNLARLCQARGDDVKDWEGAYKTAIMYRQNLSQESVFPEFVRLHFLKEYFWAETTYYGQIALTNKAKHSYDALQKVQSARENIVKIEKTINSYEQIYLEETDNPFFQDIKNKISEIKILLDKD